MKKRTMFGRILPMFLSVILFISCLTSCEINSLLQSESDSTAESGEEQNSEKLSNNDENSSSEIPEEEEPILLFFHSLTGLSCTSEQSLTRPMAFMIGNTGAGLPQYGTSYADILVETPEYDGSTKLTLVTTRYAECAKIGSIRAALPYHAEIAEFFGATLVHAGTADGSRVNSIATRNLLSADSTASAFYREAGRLSPHNIFTELSRLTNGLRTNGITASLATAESVFNFADEKETISFSGQIATHIRLDYSGIQRTEFRYQADTGLYIRYQNGIAMTDALTNTPLTARNVLILYADSTISETAESSSLTIDCSGGSGVYAADGSYIPILWQKSGDGGLVLTRTNGELLSLYTGVTHIEIMKSSLKNSVALDCE